MADPRLIESDDFPFEFLSRLAERESWRKEIHRPIYHVHKWWAKRLGSVFRGILLGSILPHRADLRHEFYQQHSFSKLSVFDPFMGSGTTVGEAHKLGLVALGRDINPVAFEAVKTALGPLCKQRLLAAVEHLSETVGSRIRSLYRSQDSRGRPCDVLYYFWVMLVNCPACDKSVDLFPSYVFARNARPDRKRQVQILCPSCECVFDGVHGVNHVRCPQCARPFDAAAGPAERARANCPHCRNRFTIVDSVGRDNRRPDFRLYAKLILTADGRKEYLPATPGDISSYTRCSEMLNDEVVRGHIQLPDLRLVHGYNTRQAMNYGFACWRDFFNDRQLLALGWLRESVDQLPDNDARSALMTLFSGVLEFNNLFASYKGEGTGAVRHMFSHHILKPERMPIEAHVWGTPKSSGSFTNLFRSRLLRAVDYQETPTEINGNSGPGRVCAPSFTGTVEFDWPPGNALVPRGIYLSCGDSSETTLAAESIDLVVTDPPFFDNVHYSELADFFYSWQKLGVQRGPSASTRHPAEVQDSDSAHFSTKLEAVFRECYRLLKSDGLLVFTYHHSRQEGWRALATAILGAGFTVVNSHPVKAEMSAATPKAQAREPIQLDIIIVCRKRATGITNAKPSLDRAVSVAKAKLDRLRDEGFALSRNDKMIVLYGQSLACLGDVTDLPDISAVVEAELATMPCVPQTRRHETGQGLLFEDLC